ncbi:MAG: LacI family DNA-binding transcriptional regulator [Lentisphaeria bacterium]|nr:LacI family DNA-binding transcriptional regulator [Lentisphaeria bacterium]
MVTLADIAAVSGCSISVVSRVLNSKPGSTARIAAATRKKVQETAAALGYRPNRNAEFLQRGKTPEIGVFLPDYGNSLILDIVRGCSEKARENGFPLSFFFNMAPDSYESFLNTTIGQRSCGLITCAPELELAGKSCELIRDYCNNGGCLVLIDSNSQQREFFPNSARVMIDDETGGRIVAKKLLASNCETFFVQAPKRPRTFGFMEFLKKAGKNATLFARDDAATDELLAQILNTPEKVGVFCGSDKIAMRLYSKLLAAGITPGDRIKLIGYDDIYSVDALHPALTTVKQPFYECGKAAVEQLLNLIYHRPAEDVIYQPHLVERGTA